MRGKRCLRSKAAQVISKNMEKGKGGMDVLGGNYCRSIRCVTVGLCPPPIINTLKYKPPNTSECDLVGQ